VDPTTYFSVPNFITCPAIYSVERFTCAEIDNAICDGYTTAMRRRIEFPLQIACYRVNGVETVKVHNAISNYR
jgi:hypothetical protein